MARGNPWVLAGVLVALATVAAVLRLAVGTTAFGLPSGENAGFVFSLRADRLIIAALVGVALSLAGVALQALLRNPLAEPYILGLSTGAATGMMAQWWIASALGVAITAGTGGAVVGAAVSMGIVYMASQKRGLLDPLGLLLTGVVLSTINGAAIMLMNHLAGPDLLGDDLMRWMMGFISAKAGSVTRWIEMLASGAVEPGGVAGGGVAVPWSVFSVMALTAGGWLILQRQARAMDVATVSDTEAQALGVNLKRLRVLLFAVSSVLAAAAVTLAGPIAFVGLVCPHIARMWVGPGHGRLLPTAAVLGAVLVVSADTVGAAIALIFGVGVVPLGVFTAIVGGVAFLWMLRPHLGRGMS